MTPDREPSGRGLACARTALAGNPSDGYGGAVLALELPAFAASVTAAPGTALDIQPPLELVAATIRRFTAQHAPDAERAPSLIVRWDTSIPRSVGLGGSSALVIATLRALCDLYGTQPPPHELAMLALRIETDDMGIAAGPQDRIVQSFGGLTLMDFAGPTRVERLDPGALPPLLVAWRVAAAESSAVVHDDLRRRWEAGERDVTAAMASLADAARTARDAVVHGDLHTLRQSVNRSFDVRRSIVALDPRHVEMVETARRAGAAVNYTGSGGAVVCVCKDERERLAAGEALSRIGCAVAQVNDESGRSRW